MISGSSSTIRTRLDTLAVYLTNSRAKHSLVTSRSSRAPPSRRGESAKIGATVEPQRSPRSHEEEPSMTTVDRKSTRLNSSHLVISYAVFCLKKKKIMKKGKG